MNEQVKELTDILKKSNAVSYEPNARQVEIQLESPREKFYVSDHDGHLTIDYSILAKDIFAADFRKQVKGEWIYQEYSMGHYVGKCSICDCEADMTNFCPNCGAKMNDNEGY
jgi:hypothetical protein